MPRNYLAAHNNRVDALNIRQIRTQTAAGVQLFLDGGGIRDPLAIAPKDKPKNEIAAIRRSGAPQQIAIPSVPLS